MDPGSRSRRPKTYRSYESGSGTLLQKVFALRHLGLYTRHNTILTQPKIKYRNTPFTYCITEIKINTLASVGTIKVVVKGSVHCAQIIMTFAFLGRTTLTFSKSQPIIDP
jgi:hypothetical protein